MDDINIKPVIKEVKGGNEMPGKEIKGVIHNAFYLRNSHGNTKELFWGRTKGENVEMFEYREDKDGKIVIVKLQ